MARRRVRRVRRVFREIFFAPATAGRSNSTSFSEAPGGLATHQALLAALDTIQKDSNKCLEEGAMVLN
jgi:hypothetical protein